MKPKYKKIDEEKEENDDEDEESLILPASLTAKKSEDFPNWMSQILQLARIIDNRFAVKSMFVWMPYGYDMMLRIKNFWDIQFRKNGIKEMYFPLLVPMKYAQQNDTWWNGFKEQGFWAGQKDKTDFILRPTGEPVMYPMFSLWIRGASDLPLRIYETVFSYRYETKQTRPLIRDREIGPWYEIHTAHATKEDAEKEIELAKVMNDLIWDFIAVKPLMIKKPKWECFAGAEGALEYYTLMPNGRVLENGSLNNLGQAYAKKFNIKFRDHTGQEKYVWQTCTGNGERYLGATLAQHGDDFGLVVAPNIAPIQVLIIPIYNKENKEKIIDKARKIKNILHEFRVEIDEKEESIGSKFYNSELNGIPLRLELGEKELNQKTITAFFRNSRKKISFKESDLVKEVDLSLKKIQLEMLQKSADELKAAVVEVKNMKDISKIASERKIAKIYWCEEADCYDKILKSNEGLELIGSDLKKAEESSCIACGRKTSNQAYVASSY